MARLTPRFSSNRSIRQYTEQHYIPAAVAYRERAANEGQLGAKIVQWDRSVRQHWAALRFGGRNVETHGEMHLIEVQVYLDDLDPEAVRVELYAEGDNGGAPMRLEMKRERTLTGAIHGHIYRAHAPASRPASDYTARLVPNCDGVAVPLEAACITWEG
jgi:starch phosphorylase